MSFETVAAEERNASWQNNRLSLNGRNSKHGLAQTIQGLLNIEIILGCKLNIDVSIGNCACPLGVTNHPHCEAPEKSA